MKKWLLRRGLKKQKERAIFEVESDIKYLEIFKADYLSFDEMKARGRMSELNQKQQDAGLQNDEKVELDKLIKDIKMSQAVKANFEKSHELLVDLKHYISLL